MYISLFRLVAAHPIMASASPPDPISTITSVLLDVLVFAFLLLAVIAFFSYTRSRSGAQARGNVSGGSVGKLGTIASVILAVPVVWLLVAGGTSFVQFASVTKTPTPSLNPGKITTPSPTIPKSTPTPASLASDLISPGKLIVGSVTNNPPQEYISGNGQTIGFDIDLIKAIAPKMGKMGLKVQIVSAPDFKTLFDGLNKRKFDVAISAVSMTSDLMQQFDFVPYFKTSESLLVPTGNPKNIKGLADLCGHSVGVQDASTELTELQMFACPAGNMITPVTQASEADAVQLLLQGAVSATYLDTPTANYYIGQNKGKFDIVATPSSAPDEGIVIRKGDTLMFNAVQAAFMSLQKDGTYSRLINAWGLTQEAVAITDQRPLGPSTV